MKNIPFEDTVAERFFDYLVNYMKEHDGEIPEVALSSPVATRIMQECKEIYKQKYLNSTNALLEDVAKSLNLTTIEDFEVAIKTVKDEDFTSIDGTHKRLKLKRNFKGCCLFLTERIGYVIEILPFLDNPIEIKGLIDDLIKQKAEELGFKDTSEIENIETVLPSTSLILNDPVSNRAFTKLITGELTAIGKKDTAVKLLIQPTADNLTEIFEKLSSIGYNDIVVSGLEPFHKAVYDAIVTLYAKGNTKITISMLNDALVGKESTLTDERKMDIVNAVMSMRARDIVIDAKVFHEDYRRKSRGRKDIPDTKFDGGYLDRLLDVGIQYSKRVNGTLVDAVFHIKTVPLLYDFAKAYNFITARPMEKTALTTTNSTKFTIPARDYIANRIYSAKKEKKPKKSSLTIAINTIFENALKDPKAVTPVQKSRYVKQIEKIFEDFKNKGEILSYEIIKEGKGNKITKVVFKVPKNKAEQ